MPYISMCVNERCPRTTECYRYRAKPNGWQSYAKFDGGKDCEYFIKYRGKSEKEKNGKDIL